MAANSQLAVATHILTILAMKPETESPKDRWVCSEHIAESIATNPVVVRRLVQELAKAGLVISHVGKHGGVELARSPHQITLADVHTALGQAEAVAFRLHTPNDACLMGTTMVDVLGPIFAEVDASVRQQLAQITLADIVHQVRACAGGADDTS